LTGGKSVSLSLQLTNSGSLSFDGPVDVDLTAIGSNSTSTPLATVKVGKLSVNSNGTKVVKIHFKVPSDFVNGTYTVQATVVAVKDNATLLSPLVAGTTTITGLNSDLALAFAAGQTLAVAPGQSGTASLTIQDVGVEPATGTYSINLYASSDSTLDPSVDSLVGTLVDQKIHLATGSLLPETIDFTLPSSDTSATYLIAQITPTLKFGDSNAANNIAVIPLT
jgi:uncharacterized membrane protein